jgi:hypothetical protein
MEPYSFYLCIAAQIDEKPVIFPFRVTSILNSFALTGNYANAFSLNFKVLQ